MKFDCRIKDFGYCPVPEHWYVDMQNQISRLYYIHGGKGWYTRGDSRFPFEAGRLYFIPYTTDAKLYSDKDEPMVHTWCDFRLTPPIVSREIFSFEAKEPIDISALSVFLDGGKIEEERWEKGSAVAEDENFQTLYRRAVLFLCARSAQLAGVAPVKDSAITHALELMHAHLAEKLTVKELSEKSFLSEGGFIRKFTREVGMTPYAYLKKLRIQTALSLKEEGLTYEAIASKTGYADASALLHALTARKE